MLEIHPMEAAKAVGMENFRAKSEEMKIGSSQAAASTAQTSLGMSPRNPPPAKGRDLVSLGPGAAGLEVRPEDSPEAEGLTGLSDSFLGDGTYLFS
jgi:hypothetical protein